MAQARRKYNLHGAQACRTKRHARAEPDGSGPPERGSAPQGAAGSSAGKCRNFSVAGEQEPAPCRPPIVSEDNVPRPNRKRPRLCRQILPSPPPPDSHPRPVRNPSRRPRTRSPHKALRWNRCVRNRLSHPHRRPRCRRPRSRTRQRPNRSKDRTSPARHKGPGRPQPPKPRQHRRAGPSHPPRPNPRPNPRAQAQSRNTPPRKRRANKARPRRPNRNRAHDKARPPVRVRAQAKPPTLRPAATPRNLALARPVPGRARPPHNARNSPLNPRPHGHSNRQPPLRLSRPQPRFRPQRRRQRARDGISFCS